MSAFAGVGHAVQAAEQHDLAVEVVGLDRAGAAGELCHVEPPPRMRAVDRA